MCPELIIGCWNFGDDNDLLFTSDYGQDDLNFLFSTFCCQLMSVLHLSLIGAKCYLCEASVLQSSVLLRTSVLASAHERNAFGPPLWSSCQAGTQKGGGFSGTALGHRPQNRAKGADPRTGTPLRRNVILPWWPGPFLSCFAVPGLSALSLLGLLSLPVCFLSFGLRSCSLRVGRRVLLIFLFG